MQISSRHSRAIIAHVADVIGGQNATAKAAEVIRAMVGEEPSYADLGAIDTAAVSEALRDASVSVVAVRRAAIAKVFTFVSESAPTCNRCGRFAYRLDGSVWARVDGSVCPIDDGLYVAETPAEPVVAWTDGRSYPPGTTIDSARVPITEESIRASRRVDPAIDAACHETGATLTQFCAALVAEMHPAAVLGVLAAPSSRFVDGVALRLFAARASTASSTRHGGNSSGFKTPPSSTINATSLRNAIERYYSDPRDLIRLAADAGINRGSFDSIGPFRRVAFNMVEEAKRSCRIDELAKIIQGEYPSCRF